MAGGHTPQTPVHGDAYERCVVSNAAFTSYKYTHRYWSNMPACMYGTRAANTHKHQQDRGGNRGPWPQGLPQPRCGFSPRHDAGSGLGTMRVLGSHDAGSVLARCGFQARTMRFSSDFVPSPFGTMRIFDGDFSPPARLISLRGARPRVGVGHVPDPQNPWQQPNSIARPLVCVRHGILKVDGCHKGVYGRPLLCWRSKRLACRKYA